MAVFISTPLNNSAANAFEQMNRMYRYQRYFYDFTRRYYLLGRDRLLERIQAEPNENILEIGCGTGRNLTILAKRYPRANFFGLDASSEMLTTARAKIDALGLINVTLKTALADDFDYEKNFGLERPFDRIFFSYSISMIPTWREAVAVALQNLKPGDKFYIVDFYDQKDLPAWFRSLLKSWLAKFHVRFWSDLLPHLAALETEGKGKLEIVPVARRYAFIAEFEKKL